MYYDGGEATQHRNDDNNSKAEGPDIEGGPACCRSGFECCDDRDDCPDEVGDE